MIFSNLRMTLPKFGGFWILHTGPYVMRNFLLSFTHISDRSCNHIEGTEISSQIHSSWLGDKVNFGLGLSYRPGSLCSLTGRYDNHMPYSQLYDVSPGQGL
jgi:hypothetical protein